MAKESRSKSVLGGSKHGEKSHKEVHHIEVHKTHGGGHVITHHHTDSEHHPSEMHHTQGDDELAAHVLQTMGTPNEGETPATGPAPEVADQGAQGAPGAGAPPPGADAPPPPAGGM
jgi:hypothetical protein